MVPKGNFRCSLEKRPPCFCARVLVSSSVYMMVAEVGLGEGGGGRFRVGEKLKIHKALSVDEVKCCQSI